MLGLSIRFAANPKSALSIPVHYNFQQVRSEDFYYSKPTQHGIRCILLRNLVKLFLQLGLGLGHFSTLPTSVLGETFSFLFFFFFSLQKSGRRITMV
jgi:hypothetical protein